MSILGSWSQRGKTFALPILVMLPVLAFLLLAMDTGPAAAFDPFWVQTHRQTDLWSGPDTKAVSFGQAPQWSYFQVVAPQQGSRLYVLNPKTKDYAYIDAGAVGPSSPPSTATPVTASPTPTPTPIQPKRRPNLPAGYEEWWVSNFEETSLWSGPAAGASALWQVPQFRRFMVVEPQNGDRLKVWSPEKDWIGYLDASVVGPCEPSIFMSMNIKPHKVVREIELPARTVGAKAILRSMPLKQDEADIRPIPTNTAVQVHREVESADGARWYEVDYGDFLLVDDVRIPPPPANSYEGKWIDVQLQTPTIVTAYEGNKAVWSCLAIRGFDGTPTRPGVWKIWNRVADETMDSETIGIPRNSPGGYLLKHVLYTQYFTNDGASFHYNYWLGTFGWPGSHGCLGLTLEDSKWLWDWASVGTTVVIR